LLLHFVVLHAQAASITIVFFGQCRAVAWVAAVWPPEFVCGCHSPFRIAVGGDATVGDCVLRCYDWCCWLLVAASVPFPRPTQVDAPEAAQIILLAETAAIAAIIGA